MGLRWGKKKKEHCAQSVAMNLTMRGGYKRLLPLFLASSRGTLRLERLSNVHLLGGTRESSERDSKAVFPEGGNDADGEPMAALNSRCAPGTPPALQPKVTLWKGSDSGGA